MAKFESFGYFVANNKEIDRRKYKTQYPHPGYGWAARKSFLNLTKGLYY